MKQIEFRAMGCGMLALVDSDSPPAIEGLAQLPEWFAGWEQCLSRFRADSELSRLNRSPGRPVPVSAVLWEVVQAALQAAEQSGGLVTPALLPALEAAGYDRSFDTLDFEQPAQQARPEVGDWRAIWTDASRRALCLPNGLRLDLGGIAKGWAADTAAGRLSVDGPALVDAGGDIAVSGPRADGQPWPVAVADPHHLGGTIAVLAVVDGGVATSGRDYRRWRRGGEAQHHILDPRTGCPAETDVLAATVLGLSAVEAEAAAKSALILGSDEGSAWIEARPDFAGLLVLEDGRTIVTRRMKDYLWS